MRTTCCCVPLQCLARKPDHFYSCLPLFKLLSIFLAPLSGTMIRSPLTDERVIHRIVSSLYSLCVDLSKRLPHRPITD